MEKITIYCIHEIKLFHICVYMKLNLYSDANVKNFFFFQGCYQAAVNFVQGNAEVLIGMGFGFSVILVCTKIE